MAELSVLYPRPENMEKGSVNGITVHCKISHDFFPKILHTFKLSFKVEGERKEAGKANTNRLL